MNRPVSGKEKKSVRLHILLEPGELTDVDDFRYANHIPTRGAAVRRLLQLGLEAASEGKDGRVKPPSPPPAT